MASVRSEFYCPMIVLTGVLEGQWYLQCVILFPEKGLLMIRLRSQTIDKNDLIRADSSQ